MLFLPRLLKGSDALLAATPFLLFVLHTSDVLVEQFRSWKLPAFCSGRSSGSSVSHKGKELKCFILYSFRNLPFSADPDPLHEPIRGLSCCWTQLVLYNIQVTRFQSV